MTKFKKCDYCLQTSKKFHRINVRGVFDSGRRMPTIFLCNSCHDYFTPSDGILEDDPKMPQELVDVIMKKALR